MLSTGQAFNEPDFASQSNIDPTYAAQLWKQYIQPLKAQGVRLGGPAVTSAPSGRPWLTTFLAACTGCTIDFLPVHWYELCSYFSSTQHHTERISLLRYGTGVGNFYDYIWSFHGQFPNYPIWITEYASTSTDDAGEIM